MRLFNAATPFVITNLSTTSVIKGSLDARVIARLNKYAVADRMSLLKMRPTSLVMSFPTICTAQALLSPDEYSSQPQEVPAGRDCAAILGGASQVLWPDASFMQNNGGLKSPSLSNFSFGIPEDSPIPLFSAPLGKGTILMDTDSPPVMSEPRTSHSYNDNSGPGLMPTRQGDESDSHSNGTERQGSRKRLKSRDIAPRPEGQENPSVSPSERTCEQATSEPPVRGEKEVKAELRKMRNRAAAARSNVKRKIRNETLRRDLAEITRRETELRALETVLREENVKLRGLATQQKYKVSDHLSHIQITRTTS